MWNTALSYSSRKRPERKKVKLKMGAVVMMMTQAVQVEKSISGNCLMPCPEVVGKDREGSYPSKPLHLLPRVSTMISTRGESALAMYLTAASLLDYTKSVTEGASSVCNSHAKSAKRSGQHLSTTAEKILDAPTIMDDYCKSLVLPSIST